MTPAEWAALAARATAAAAGHEADIRNASARAAASETGADRAVGQLPLVRAPGLTSAWIPGRRIVADTNRVYAWGDSVDGSRGWRALDVGTAPTLATVGGAGGCVEFDGATSLWGPTTAEVVGAEADFWMGLLLDVSDIVSSLVLDHSDADVVVDGTTNALRAIIRLVGTEVVLTTAPGTLATLAAAGPVLIELEARDSVATLRAGPAGVVSAAMVAPRALDGLGNFSFGAGEFSAGAVVGISGRPSVADLRSVRAWVHDRFGAEMAVW